MLFGKREINRALVLAPMDDVTDSAFRVVARRLGADVVVTEFISCEALIRDAKKAFQKMTFTEEERPVGIQIFGNIEANMVRAAQIAEERQPDFIDINAGCWVKDVAMRGAGAGLLRDLPKLEAIVKAVVKAVQIPVTLKTRLGWKADEIVIPEVAKMAEQAGVQSLCLHCRTRDQGHSGAADWSWLEKIKSMISIPLVGNGDAKSPENVRTLFGTGCDGVMIGRAAIANPWIFREAKQLIQTGSYSPPSVDERIQVCLDHLRSSALAKGERRGVIEFRKYYSGYLRGLPMVAKLRAELMQFTEMEPVIQRLYEYQEALRALPINVTELPPLGGLIGTRYETPLGPTL